MCGIVGVWDFSNKIDSNKLKVMRDLLEHRGPDDKGIFIDGNIGLAHRRLSIIDLSKSGHQPMCNEDESIWITYNGEIYNFISIKENLLKKGHKFKSDTDTEVIIHAYEEYGEKCLNLFNGMFAFAIWDKNRKILFCARDRLGVKPFVYYLDADKFVFASELKAILPYPGICKIVNEEAIMHYLSFGYVPAPYCIFKNMFKLEPGHYAIVNKNCKIKIEQYWDIDLKNVVDKPEDEYCKEIIKNLKNATEKRMISDVPLGAFLSGGIDSSAIVAMMSQLSDKPVKTFSIGFEEQDFDETKYARLISDKFNTEHKEQTIEMDAIKILDKLVWHYCEPYGDSSAIPTFYLSAMTRKHVTVALSGDGGDENFLGYSRYALNQNERIARFIPRFISPVIKNTGLGIRIMSPKLGDKIKAIGSDPGMQYYDFISFFKDYEKKSLLKENMQKYDSKKILLCKTNKYKESILKKQYFDIKHYIPDDLNTKVDIASMAHSLEVRSPFLDYELMENAAKVPASIKMKDEIKKYILKKALKGTVPDEILFRRKKGFSIPLIHWFRKDLKSMSYDLLLERNAAIRKYVNQDYIRKLLEQHMTGKDNSSKLWSLLFLEKWFKRFTI